MFAVTSKNPGPGTYEPKTAIDKKGFYFNSKFKNSLAAQFDPICSKRFKDNTKRSREVPGPG